MTLLTIWLLTLAGNLWAQCGGHHTDAHHAAEVGAAHAGAAVDADCCSLAAVDDGCADRAGEWQAIRTSASLDPDDASIDSAESCVGPPPDWPGASSFASYPISVDSAAGPALPALFFRLRVLRL